MIVPEQESGTSLRARIWYSLGTVMISVNSFIMLLVVSQFTNVETVGEFGISLTTAQLLFIVGIFGAASYQITDYLHSYRFADYFWLKIASSLLFCLAVLPFLGTADNERQQTYLLLLSVFMLWNSFAELYQSQLFQYHEIILFGKARFFRNFFCTAAFAAVMLLTGDLVLSLVVMIAVNLAATWFWAIQKAKPYTEHSHRFEKAGVFSLAKTCFPLFLSVLLMAFLVNIPKYVIDAISTNTAQGYYNILIVPAMLIILVSQFIFIPALKQYSSLLDSGRTKQYIGLLAAQSGLVMILTIAAGVFLWFAGVPLLSLFYAVDISAFRWNLIVIVLGGGVASITQMMYYILLMLRKQIAMFLCYCAGALVSWLIAWQLIENWGISGACYAFLLSHILLLALFCIVLAKSIHTLHKKLVPDARSALRPSDRNARQPE